MSEHESVVNLEKSESSTWLDISVGRWIALIGAFSVYAVHLTGKTIHETYLGNFGIDPNLFPRSLDDIATLGQMGLIDRLTVIFVALMKTLEAKGLWFLFAGSFFIFLILWSNRRLPKKNSLNKNISQLVWWVKAAGKSVGLIVLMTSGIVYGYVCLLMLLLMPVAMGQSVGFERYKHDAEIFNRGCQATTRHCVELFESNKLIAEGFVIDSSPTHIALYDVKRKQSRAMERAKTELRVKP